MMKKQPLTFNALEDYKAKGLEHAEKTSAIQQKVNDANAEVERLTSEYETLFMKAVKSGKDETAKLNKIEADLKIAKENQEKTTRDNALTLRAMPAPEFDTVQLVQDFNTVYAPQVRENVVTSIDARMRLARDLILSALQDFKEADAEYQEVTEEVSRISKSNKERGLTREYMGVSHPTKNAKILGQSGIQNAMQKIIEQYNGATRSSYPHDFKYIEDANLEGKQ